MCPKSEMEESMSETRGERLMSRIFYRIVLFANVRVIGDQFKQTICSVGTELMKFSVLGRKQIRRLPSLESCHHTIDAVRCRYHSTLKQFGTMK